MRGSITRKDIKAGKKRVNLSLTIREFDDLFLVAEHDKISFTSLACSWVVQRARDNAEKIRKSGYIPLAQRGEKLFRATKIKTRGKVKNAKTYR